MAYYRAHDVGAPVLNGNAGSLIEVLHAVLVTGYFSKDHAGWSLASYGPKHATFRPHYSSVLPFFLTIDDDPSGGMGAVVRGFRRIEDVERGTEQLPKLLQPREPGSVIVPKPKPSDAFTCDWKIVATNIGFYMWLQCKELGLRTTYAFGDIYSMHGSLELEQVIDKNGISEQVDGIASVPRSRRA